MIPGLNVPGSGKEGLVGQCLTQLSAPPLPACWPSKEEGDPGNTPALSTGSDFTHVQRGAPGTERRDVTVMGKEGVTLRYLYFQMGGWLEGVSLVELAILPRASRSLGLQPNVSEENPERRS